MESDQILMSSLTSSSPNIGLICYLNFRLKNENKHFLLTKTDKLRANDKDKHRITYFWDKGVTVTLYKEELINLVQSITKKV